MIKTYTTTVKAEAFDGSKEMVSRYPIKSWKSSLYYGGIGYALKLSSRYEEDEVYNQPLRVGQYIVTTPAGGLMILDPFDFCDLFPEADDE